MHRSSLDGPLELEEGREEETRQRLTVLQALLYRRQSGRRKKLTSRFADRYRPSEWDTGTADPLDWLLAEERRQMVRAALSRWP